MHHPAFPSFFAWSLVAWVGMMIGAMVNGWIRETYFVTVLNEKSAFLLSGLGLLIIIATATWVLLKLYGPLSSHGPLWVVGVLWVVLMLLFEIALFVGWLNKPLLEILAVYHPRALLQGQIILINVLFTLIAPRLIYSLLNRHT